MIASYIGYRHRLNEERAQGVAEFGKKEPKWGLFGMFSFMKIPLVTSSLDQKEQNCFGQPKFYILYFK